MLNCQKIVKKMYKKCKRIVSKLQHLQSFPEGASRAITVRNGVARGVVRLRCGTGGRGTATKNNKLYSHSYPA